MSSENDELKHRRDLLMDQIQDASASGDEHRRQELYAELEGVLRELKEEQ